MATPPPPLPQPQTSSAVAVLGKRLLTYAVLVGVALLALKLFAGVVVGLVTTVLTMVAIVAVVIAAIWAFRRL